MNKKPIFVANFVKPVCKGLRGCMSLISLGLPPGKLVLFAFAMVLTSDFVSVLVVFNLFAVSSAITVPRLNASLSKAADQHKEILL